MPAWFGARKLLSMGMPLWYDPTAFFVIDAMRNRAMVRIGTATGPELVTNWDFSSPIGTGWTNVSTGSGNATIGSGVLTLVANGAGNRGIARQSITTVVGQLYEFTALSFAGSIGIAIGVSAADTTIYNTSHSANIIARFIAITTTTYIDLWRESAAAGVTVSSFSIKAVLPGGVVAGSPEELIAGGYLTYSRADSVSYQEATPGVWAPVSTGVLRRRYDGSIHIEPSATNLFWNSFTPSTQTRTISNGVVYTVSCAGSGSITLSDAGSGTVSAGSPVTFTAGSTSLTATVSGSLTWMQLEAGSVATSPISTPVNASAVRAADAFALSTTNLSIPTDGTLVAEFTSAYDLNSTGLVTAYLLAFDTVGNSMLYLREHTATGSKGPRAGVGDGTTTSTLSPPVGVSLNTVGRCALRYKNSSADAAFSVIGQTATSAVCACVFGVPSAIGLGKAENALGSQMTGTIRYLAGLSKVMSNAELAIESARYA